MTRKELIAYDRWLTENKWGSSEIITPEQAADLYLTEHPLPPVEGAEKPNAMKFLSDNGYGSGFNYTTKQVANLMQEFAAQPQPTAEGAEEILAKYEIGYDEQYHRMVYEGDALKAMYEFATLHAQRIADKIVSERLKEYHLNEGYDVVIVGNPDKEIPGDIFEDIKVAALELGELRGLKVMITGFTANYLKTRDNHESV